MAINSYWWEFAKDIGNKLAMGENIPFKQKTDMEECWKQAVKKGVKF